MAGVSGTFTGMGSSSGLKIGGRCPLSLSGTWVATIKLQRSFDNGSNWLDVDTFSSNQECVINGTGELYRLTCSAFTSGTVAYRLGAPE